MIQLEALAVHEFAQQHMAECIKLNFKPFIQNQKIWLSNQNLKTSYNKKITTKQEGPFQIKEVLGPVTYCLELPRSWKIHDSFHAGLLSPFKQNDVHGPAYTRPPPENIEGHQEYKVDHIKKHSRYCGKQL